MATLPPLSSPALRRAAAALQLAAGRFYDLWSHAKERFPEWFEDDYPSAGLYFVEDVDCLSDLCAFAAKVVDPSRTVSMPTEAPELLPGESGKHVPGIESAAAFLRVARDLVTAELEEAGDDVDDPRRQWLAGLTVCLDNAWESNLQGGSTVDDADGLIAPGLAIYEAAAALVDGE